MTRRLRLRLPRPGRAAARVAAAFMITGTIMLVAAGPSASAISLPFVGNCKSPPAPQLPGQGVSAWISGSPSPLPAAGTAFGPHPTSTEYEQYGYAGLSWNWYDLGCVSGPVDVGPQLDTMIGNMFMAAAKVYVALDNQVHNWAASPAWISDLNPLVISASRVMHDDLFGIWAGLALLILAAFIIGRVHRGNVADAVTKVGWALLVLALVGGVFNFPTLAGEATSGLMSQTLNAMSAGFTGPAGEADAAKAHDSLVVTAVLYDQWVYGELGPAYTQTAQTYGPQLFQAQALTWQQAAASPEQVAKAENSAQAEWAKVAAEVQKADPSAYQNLKGTGQSRFGAGLLAAMLAFVVCTFDLYASLVVIMALLSVLMAVIIFPGLAVVGLHHDARNWVTDLLSRVLGLLVAGVLYAAAAGIDSRATVLLLTTHVVPLQMAILLLAILPIVLWVLLRRIRNRSLIPRPVMYGAAPSRDAVLDPGRREGQASSRASPTGTTGPTTAAATTTTGSSGRTASQTGGGTTTGSQTTTARCPRRVAAAVVVARCPRRAAAAVVVARCPRRAAAAVVVARCPRRVAVAASSPRLTVAVAAGAADPPAGRTPARCRRACSQVRPIRAVPARCHPAPSG